MTTLREAAQQALEALLDDQNKLVQISENHWESKRDLAVIALNAALAEPEELRENERLREAVAAEREACAKLAEPSEEHRRDASWGYAGGEGGVELLDSVAAAIRARGEA